ncbi:hypothetical protein ECANGB1_1354 [Enterospora canceri]|uniref:Uncharacterized protein n=1 Tax=Enterospora canceri TaxID=1081671 RepID=A0A1Y1S3Z9_9MICR|nr:hypothetical protein ECANGB1_1354 [Enterospora canceri]
MLFDNDDGSSSDDQSAEYVDRSGTSQTEQGVFKTKVLSENESNLRLETGRLNTSQREFETMASAESIHNQ